MMPAIIWPIVRWLGVTGCLLIGVVVYEEGFPFLNRYPWLANLPIVGDLALGHVRTYAADQVKIATAQSRAVCDGRIEKMVSTAQYDALAAQLAEERSQRAAADQLSEENRKRADAAIRDKAATDERLETILAKENSRPDGDYWTDDDLEWLRQQRGLVKAPGRAAEGGR